MSRKELRAAIGARLREARVQAKLTQEDVACEFSRTRQSVSAWEAGRTLPSIEELRDLSTRYGVSTDLLIHGLDVAKVGKDLLQRAATAARAGASPTAYSS